MNTPGVPPSDDDRTAELLSQALHEEAGRVTTDPAALQAIQARTSRSGSSRRSWVYAGLGAAAATAAVIAGVSVLHDSSGGNSAGPATGGQTQATIGQASPVDVTVTYLGAPANAWRLVTEHQTVAPVPGGGPDLAAVHAFLTAQPSDDDYSSGWPSGLDVSGIATSKGTIQVDLTGPVGGLEQADPSLSSDARGLAVQALLRTAGGQVGDAATLTYNGNPVQTVFGIDLPVTVASDDETRAFITVDNLVDGQPVSNPVSVVVSGNVFEGTVNWELLNSAGTKVDDGFVTTSMGQWTQATIDLGTLDPGTYTIRCLEYSPANGKPGQIDDKTFTVS